MGIKGLKQFLHSITLFQEEIILNKSTLHIDGNGLLFYLINKDSNFHIELLGCYDILYDIVNNELQQLILLNFTIIIYFDGKSQMKEKTALKRLNDNNADWDNLFYYCNQNDSVLDKSKSLPLPKLAIKQFKSILKKIDGIQVVNCPFEADRVIAEACLEGNKSLEDEEELHYCYGSDSDFYVYKDCPYIELGSLKIINNHTAIADHVWRLNNTLSSLEMSQSQFIEFCSLVGNDYTSCYERCFKYGDIEIPLELRNKNINRIEELYHVIVNNKDGLILSSDDLEINKALCFSRELYTYKDISKYDIDNDISHLRLYALSIEYKELVKNNLNDDVLSIINALSTLIAVSLDTGVYSFINSVIFEALSLMLKHLQGLEEFDISSKIFNNKLSVDEVLSAHYYQQICSEYLYIYNDEYNVEPYQLYNGKLYLEILQYIKSNSKMSITKNNLIEENETKPQIKSNRNTNNNNNNFKSVVVDKLPIDNYRKEILKKIHTDRVIIIHGETGCGKSSRLPVILLEDAMQRNKECKMMVSQPRRIAASSLMKRVKETIGDKVGLRMGFGVRDDNDDSAIIFVTTGYLVRLLAYRPHVFRNHNYLIIDEVHERSVDCDVLCFLARKLLSENENIKIILMSATIHVDLYSNYFSIANVGEYVGDLECLSVGVKRFQVDVVYIDDLMSSRQYSSVISRHAEMVNSVLNKTDKIDSKLTKHQFNLVEVIIRTQVLLGTACLIFLAGITDITDLAEKFENISTYRIIIIHSEIPLEDQELAFSPTDSKEIKVILATNAAESSITLPDVDTVICCGSHKAIRYSTKNHQSELANCWISKASATQRAGRTGRVRPGKCFRLYNKKIYNSLDEHEPSEVTRTPAQELILNLRVMFQDAPSFDGVIPILMNLIESPDMVNIQNSFQYLHESGMITSPDDRGNLTSLGRFAGQVPVDLQMSKLISTGVVLGIQNEAVIIASALTQPRSLFRSPSPIVVTDPDEYLNVVKQVYLGSVSLDNNLYSEPLMYLRAYVLYLKQPVHKRDDWISSYGLVHQKFKSFVQSTTSLLYKVREIQANNFREGNRQRASFNNTNDPIDIDDILDFETLNFNGNKLLLLRLLLLWSCDGKIIKHTANKTKDLENVILENSVKNIDNHLSKVFAPVPRNSIEIPWQLSNVKRKIYDGKLSESRLGRLGFIDYFIKDIVFCACNGDEILSPVVWIHDKLGLPCLPNGNINAVLSKNKATNGEKMFIAVSDYSNITLLFDIIPSNRLIPIADGIYVCISPSKKEIEEFHVFIEKISRGLYMVIPKDGNAKVNCYNVDVETAKLENLFFTNDKTDILTQNNTLSKKEMKKLLISEQIITSQSLIKFGESNDLENDFINDLPLGYRLVNAIRNGYKSRQLYVKDTSNSLPISAPIGSKSWAQQRNEHNVNESSVLENKIEIKVSTYLPKWNYINLNSTTSDNVKNCLLPRQTVCGASIDVNKTLYAPFYGLLLLSEAKAIVCEKISFLPCDYRWLYLAFRCSKWCNYSDLVDKLNIDNDIADKDKETCEIIRQLLDDSNNNSIQRDASLIDLIHDLFFNQIIKDKTEETDLNINITIKNSKQANEKSSKNKKKKEFKKKQSKKNF